MKKLLLFAVFIQTLMAQDYYKITEENKIEVKKIPAATLMESSAKGNYFDSSGDLFRPLFGYLKSHSLSMTSPVEADISKAKMRFFVEPSRKDEALAASEKVKIFKRPEMTVVSIGIKGSYSEENFNEGVGKLNDWLKKNTAWKKAGEPMGVYWDSPFTLWFRKRSEVQIPVVKAE